MKPAAAHLRARLIRDAEAKEALALRAAVDALNCALDAKLKAAPTEEDPEFYEGALHHDEAISLTSIIESAGEVWRSAGASRMYVEQIDEELALRERGKAPTSF